MLVAVVGPSGAGKDTLMGLARARLDADARFRFVQRAITRPAEAGGEAHRPLSVPAFEAEQAAGAFALSWNVHGLLYGIPRDIEADLAGAAGRGGEPVARGAGGGRVALPAARAGGDGAGRGAGGAARRARAREARRTSRRGWRAR